MPSELSATDIGFVESTLPVSELESLLRETVQEAIERDGASEELKASGIDANNFRVSRGAAVGLVEGVVIAVVGAIGKKVVDEVWDYVKENLKEKNPANIDEVKDIGEKS